MPRRKPTARPGEKVGRSAGRGLSAGDLGELLTQAKVPKGERAACAEHINQLFEWYRRCLAGNEQTEARAAESMRQVTGAARELYRALASLPPALRLAAEPDYRVFAARIEATQVAAAVAYAASTGDLAKLRDLAKRDPDPEACSLCGSPDITCLATEVASLPLIARAAVRRQRRERLPLVLPLPLEHILAALIETTERRRLEFEAQVSREWSRNRRTFARNELALNLKSIIMGCSPALANDERAAQGWVASVLDAAEIPYPKRETNPTAFNRMFARRRRKPLI
jgi:hypothetical protein